MVEGDIENETVRNPVDVSGSFRMWMASVQTMVLLERFSMVVVLRRANWRELPVIPRLNRPKSAPLEAHQLLILHARVLVYLQAYNDEPVDIESMGLYNILISLMICQR